MDWVESSDEKSDTSDDPTDLGLPGGKMSKGQKSRTVKRTRWTSVEHDELTQHFKSYLDAGIVPRTKQVEQAKKKSLEAGGQIWMRTTDKIVKKN